MSKVPPPLKEADPPSSKDFSNYGRPDRKSVNLGIVRDDGTTTTNSDEAANALSDSWTKVFAPKSINLDKAIQFAKANIAPMNLEGKKNSQNSQPC